MEYRKLVVLGAVFVVMMTGSTALAQSNSGEWQFAIAPYLWAAGMDGSMAVAIFEEDVDVPFSTIIENLDFAFMGHFDMRNDHWALSSDLIFVDLEQSEDVTEGTVTAGLDLTLFEIAGGYRVSEVFTVLAGGRWVDMGAGLHYDGAFADEGADVGRKWIDPLIGVHAFVPLSKKWWLGLRGDIGGFGVGSEFAWHAYADIGFRASHLVSIVLGYRALDMDYEDGSGRDYVNLDLLVSGAQLGVAFTF